MLLLSFGLRSYLNFDSSRKEPRFLSEYIIPLGFSLTTPLMSQDASGCKHTKKKQGTMTKPASLRLFGEKYIKRKEVNKNEKP